MKHTKLVIAAMLMISAAAASAKNIDLGTLDLTDTTAFSGDITGVSGSAFSDTYTFQLSSQADFNGFVSSTWSGRGTSTGLKLTTFDLYHGTNIVASGVTGGLYGPNGKPLPGSSASLDGLAGLQSGFYSLTIGGSLVGASGKGSYSGTINVSPVPEPETWGLTLSGLAAVGFLARRRKSGSKSV